MCSLETKRKIELYEGWVELGRDTAHLKFYFNLYFLNQVPEEDFIDTGYPVKGGETISSGEAVRRLNEILESGVALTPVQKQFIFESFYSYESPTRLFGRTATETLKKIQWLISEYPFYCEFCHRQFIPRSFKNNLCSECQVNVEKIHRVLRYNRQLRVAGKQRKYKSKSYERIKRNVI